MTVHLTEFDRRRLEIYLGGVERGPSGDQDSDPPEESKVIACRACESQASIRAKTSDRFDDAGFDVRFEIYIGDAQAFVAGRAPFRDIRIMPEDNRARLVRPTILKSRMISDRDSQGVIFPLEFERHWSPLRFLARDDLAFSEKDDKLVWRGTTTGYIVARGGETICPPRYHLFYHEPFDDGMDVKFNIMSQTDGWPGAIPEARVKALLGDELTIAEQLKSKHLLVLEGNDVATSLKWAMGSNSVVVMPPPTCETWFCEGELEAWTHYVPIQPDLSDLNQIYAWCLSNPGECEKIAAAGRAFVAQFLEVDRELRILKEVVRGYLGAARGWNWRPNQGFRSFVETLQHLAFRRNQFEERLREYAHGSGLVRVMG